MSTKSTIAHGRNFHFYHEALDEDYVYLELEGTKFEASYNRVMVPIPVHVWEVIRRYPGSDLRTCVAIRLFSFWHGRPTTRPTNYDRSGILHQSARASTANKTGY